MNKIFTLIAAAMMAVAANAADLFTGSKHVSWDEGGLQFEAEKFADAKAGDKIVVTYTGASDGIEFKVMDDFDRLPGSLQFKGIGGDGTFEQFLTPAAVAKIKSAGLEIIGANFTATKVELLEGKDNVSAGTVWTGYFWMDEWSTLELSKASFNDVNWAGVEAIRFYSEAGRTDYVINVKVNWDPDGHIADAGTMTMTQEYAELSLAGIDMQAYLDKSDRLMIQCNKEGGAPFNFTAVELVQKESAGVATLTADQPSSLIFDLAGRKTSADAKGLMIVGGKVRKF